MTRPRHTPGPWRIHRLTNGWPLITSDAHDIADLRLNGKSLLHTEANAALIAAAPELLDVLDYVQATLKLRQLDEASDDEVEEALAMADAALAKATTIENQPRSDHHA